MKRLFTIYFIAAFFSVACNSNSRDTGGANNPPPSDASSSPVDTNKIPPTTVTETPPATVETPPPPVKDADLAILSVTMKKVTTGGSTSIEFSADLINNGPGDASFDCYCKWDCIAGDIVTNGVEIVQAGFLSAGKRSTYSGMSGRPCAYTPSSLNVTCEVKVRSQYVDGNTSNNKWVGNLTAN